MTSCKKSQWKNLSFENSRSVIRSFTFKSDIFLGIHRSIFGCITILSFLLTNYPNLSQFYGPELSQQQMFRFYCDEVHPRRLFENYLLLGKGVVESLIRLTKAYLHSSLLGDISVSVSPVFTNGNSC